MRKPRAFAFFIYNIDMKYILFPGRHLLTTKFQQEYLSSVAQKDSTVVYAVTSANQAGSRYNPLPLWIRTLGVDRFAQHTGLPSRIVPIPHFGHANNFAELVIKYTNDALGISINPENTQVLCSTPPLITMYQDLGYDVLTAEYDLDTKKYIKDTPSEIMKSLMSSRELTHQALSGTQNKLIKSVPEVFEQAKHLWNDPLLTEEGSLTEDRDYNTYAYGMANDAFLDIKYNDIKHGLVSGRIVDEGCADAALIARMIKEDPDSDYIGVDIASEFIARCHERQRVGDFGSAYVNFYQRNILDDLFEDETISTTICNSTTHEIYSYGNGEDDLYSYLTKKYKQTKVGGHLVIRDVVGPEDKDKVVYAWLNDTDGQSISPEEAVAWTDLSPETLDGLSTRSRFFIFAQTFQRDLIASGRKSPDNAIGFDLEKIKGKEYIKTTFREMTEYMTKKDYTDSWMSEMNEQFAYWSFSEWKDALREVGFKISEGVDKESSYSYTSEWIIENRWEGKVRLYVKENEELKEIPYPPTNMVLIGEK